MIIAASTTGSTAACGIEPCAPRPYTVMLMLSAADRTAPDLAPRGRPVPEGRARSRTVGPSPLRSTPTTPVPPMPSRTSYPMSRSRSATFLAVSCS